MDNQRKLKLIETLKKINKDQGQNMEFAESADDIELIYSGIPAFDKFTGGLKKGAFTVAWGGESCGKSTLCLQIIANAQKNGYICVYIDMEHSFDKVRAVQLGVNLQELILVTSCQTAEEAEEIVRTLAKEKVVDLVIVDSIQAMSPKGEQEDKNKQRDLASREMAELARNLSKFFRVVNTDVFNAKLAVLLIGQSRMSLGSFIVRADLSGGQALKHWATQTIFMRRGQGTDAPSKNVVEYFLDPDGKLHKETTKEACGFDGVLKLTKTKSSTSAVEFSEIHLPFLYDRGFVETVPEESERISITGTEEEKAIVTQKLIEKGILYKKELAVNLVINNPTQLVETVEEPKKRGRKAGSKNKKEK